jgi:iron complex transport system substrate-binding protein
MRVRSPRTLLMPFVLALLCVELLLASSSRSAEPRVGADVATRGPLRVAALLPWVADAVAVAGKDAKLVAGVRRSLHEPLPAGLVDLGNPHSPSLERLVEVHPDLVVVDRAIHARLTPQIEKLGAKVLPLGTDSVAETLASLDALSAAIGRPAPLEARIAEVRARIGALADRSEASVVALFGAPGSFYVMTERAWLGDLARHVGLDLAIAPSGDERFPGLVAVSDEAMAMAHPDLVLLVAHGDPGRIRADLERRTAEGGAWSGLAGARLGIHVLDPDLFSANPGLEIVRAAEALVALVPAGPET